MSNRIRLVLLILCLVGAGRVDAGQRSVRVDGTSALVAASQRAAQEVASVQVTTPPAGTGAALRAFCAGDIQIANADRPIGLAEAGRCAANDIVWVEMLVGYTSPVVVTLPDSTLPSCRSSDDIARAWAGHDGLVFGPGDAEMPARFAAALDLPVEWAGEVELLTDAGAMAGQMDPESLGVLAYSDYALAPDGTLRAVEVDAGAGCMALDEAALLGAAYPFVAPLYVYVNAEIAADGDFLDYIDVLVGGLSLSDGVLPPGEDVIDLNREILVEGITGRTFTALGYGLPEMLRGEVMVNTPPAFYELAFDVAQQFGERYGDVAVQIGLEDGARALEQVCDGELDAALFDHPVAGCDGDAMVLDVGYVAVGLAVEPSSEVECLTEEELRLAWQPESEGMVMNWTAIRDGLADRALVSCAPYADLYPADFFTEVINGEAGAIRLDYVPGDPGQVARCAGDLGGLAFMDYGGYMANLDHFKPLAVGEGAGCTRAGQAAVRAGIYPLARPLVLVTARPDEAALAYMRALLMQIMDEPVLGSGVQIISPTVPVYLKHMARLAETD